MATDITVAGTSIQYRDFEITVPISSKDIAPSAELTTTADTSIDANDALTITIDGTPVFEGLTRSGGTKSELGGQEVRAAHAARDLFEETVSLSLLSPTTEDVLTAALANSNSGGSFTIDYAGTATNLDNDYDVTDRSVKRVFRDMMDRTGRVWWVDPAGTTIHVEQRGGRGLWQTIDTQADGATLQRFDEGNVDTIRNAVTVVGTGEEQVRATATDQTSIDTYGRRPGNSPYNVSYVTVQSEAAALAQELLVPDPLPEGKLLVGSNIGDVTAPLVNQTVDVLDQGLNIDANALVIESQTIEQGRATLAVGAGSGTSIEEINRTSKSDDDVTEPGSVYGSARLADDSVDTAQLVDGSVIEQKLQDAAVATAKLENNAVINGKLDDLSVSETKIQDGSISTPKIQTEAVTANEILADTITAAEIAAGTITASEIAADTITASEIAADTITALEIAADTLTANEIDVLDLAAGELSVTDANSNGIDFDTATLNNQTLMSILPTGDGQAIIGSDSSAFDQANIDNIDLGNVLAVQSDTGILRPSTDNTGSVGNSVIAWEEMHSYQYVGQGDAAGTPEIIPANDVTGSIGKLGNAWQSVRSANFITDSPEPVAKHDRENHPGKALDAVEGPPDIDLGELTNVSWYDPPDYIRREQRARAKGAGDGTADDGAVEIGTAANYLLEVCKRQMDRIESLTTRNDDLEQTVADLEQRLSALEEQV